MNIITKIIGRIRRIVLRHRIYKAVTPIDFEILRLGSDYGCKQLVNLPSLKGGTLISAGLGEDASFDIEFASRFDAKVILIDPTPRAIDHYDSITKRFGNSREMQYVSGGAQNAACYDLTKVSQNNLPIIPVALASEDGEAEFFMPINATNVSHSLDANLHGISNNFSITVKKMTLNSVCKEASIDPAEIEVIKLDIEGAELDVIENLLDCEIWPNQILVEYDELNYPTLRGNKRVTRAHEILMSNGYILCATDSKSDFTYLLHES